MNAQNDNSEINPRGPGAMVTQNWNSLPTINIKDGSYYHNIGADLISYGSNLSTYWYADNTNGHFDNMWNTHTSRVTYLKKFRVDYGDQINLFATTTDGGDGGYDITDDGKLYWNVMEYDEWGNGVWDSGWHDTDSVYTVGVTDNMGQGFSSISRTQTKYIVLIFKYATGDYSISSWAPDIKPQEVVSTFSNICLVYRPYTYTINDKGDISTVQRTGIQTMTPLWNPTKAGYHFTGWHISSPNNWFGGNNWMNGTIRSTEEINHWMSNNRFYTSLFGDVTFTAQFSPNTYTIRYFGNGATGGDTPNSYHTYDSGGNLSKNGFTRTGYTFRGWSVDTGYWSYFLQGGYHNFNSFNPAFYANAYPDLKDWLGYNADSLLWHYYNHGQYEGRICVGDISDDRSLFPDGAYVANLTQENLTHDPNRGLSFYAQWKPNIYEIVLDNCGADTMGTSSYLVKYEDAYYESGDWGCTNVISSIMIPTKVGYNFGGYYTGINGNGKQCVDESGRIVTETTYFTENTVLYAKWDKYPEMKENTQKTYVRFISIDFCSDESGNFIPKSQGGLEENSVWRTETEYRNLLKDTLSASKINVETKTVSTFGQIMEVEVCGTGEWVNSEETWVFKNNDIQEMKIYTYNYGHVMNAIKKFCELFQKCKQ